MAVKIEVTEEIRSFKEGKYKKQVCYLHSASNKYPQRFEMWANEKQIAPGMYVMGEDSIYVNGSDLAVSPKLTSLPPDAPRAAK